MKRVVITGGSGALGSVIAGVFRESSWAVDALGSSDLDLSDEAAISDYFREKPIDLLICAAGATYDAPLIKLSEENWDKTVSINFTAANLCARAALPALLAKGEGHIIFISSQSALHPPIGQAAYATAKAALLGLTVDFARRHGNQNIRVNAILPGFLETKMTAAVSERRRSEVLAEHQLGRFNTPAAVAAFILYLQEHMPHTSGQVFQLDSRCPIP